MMITEEKQLIKIMNKISHSCVLLITALVVELVDTTDLKSVGETSYEGSSPSFGTNIKYEP